MRHGRRQSLCDKSITLQRSRPWRLHQFYNVVLIPYKHHETFRGHCLKSTVDLLEKIQQLFPNLDLRDFPPLEPFANLEPADFFHDYLEQETSKGKGSFIQAV
ncbi:hypothetical protein TNCV_847581 [Trichonephila clavipes]|nr:hypothetical protein TNCV_847581 [Trichonephila clavipes]